MINSEKTINDASIDCGLKREEIAEIISAPISHQFFSKNNNTELTITSKFNWFSTNLEKKLNLRKDENKILDKMIKEKLGSHLEEYWMENGKINRDLKSRTVEEWLENELSFVAGFSLWFREKETKGEIDLSSLISNATGDDVKASGTINFDRKRLELLKGVPMKTIKKIMEMSPAGKIAYRSMDMAIIQGISEGDNAYASSMKERTQNKSWWKFWK